MDTRAFGHRAEPAPRGEPGSPASLGAAIERRALAIWPRLGRAALRRCRQDPRRIAALISRRTSMAPEAILRILMMPSVSDDELGTWFG